jgi:CBS domain-containing protein
MTAPALTIHRTTPLGDAARKMERHHVHRLVVVADDDDRLPIGVISTSDLVHAMTIADRAQRPPFGGETPETPDGG